jgi:hypothetical protein
VVRLPADNIDYLFKFAPCEFNAGHDTRAIHAWMGHKNIQHTVRYTEVAPDRFEDFCAIRIRHTLTLAAFQPRQSDHLDPAK